MDCKKLIMQGDSYYLPIKLTNHDIPIDINEFKIIEFSIGELTKYWKLDGSGDVIYDDEFQTFKFSLSQEETFAFKGKQKVSVRVQDIDNYIIGKEYGYIDIIYNSQGRLL